MFLPAVQNPCCRAVPFEVPDAAGHADPATPKPLLAALAAAREDAGLSAVFHTLGLQVHT